MIENERGTAINPDDAVQEKISLSDRFGRLARFHSCSQDDYLAMLFGYAEHFGLALAREKIAREALEWSVTRGARWAAPPGDLSRISRGDWARRWSDLAHIV